MSNEVTAFLDAYRDSFRVGPAAVASFYAEPCITARSGLARAHPSQVETTALFTEIEGQYQSRGFTHADYVLLGSEPLGANSFLATVQWTYRNAASHPLWVSTVTYNVYRCDGDWKILVQTMHDS
jgi:hypothetical protein